MKLHLLMGAAFAPLAIAMPAFAAEPVVAPVVQPQDRGPVTALDEVIVTGEPQVRNRTDDAVPTLSYDLEYFQRFEPLTAGDALKRVPSVAFLSDVLESDGVRLRGLDPGYTQILINGERVPGAGVDRSFFVDRIPAELIERVEVVRSSSANRSGDAVAGAINIVLRDALSLDGGYVRLGALKWDDSEYGEFGGTAGAVWGGEVGPGRLLLGANVQDRRNPKEKFSQRFDEPNGELDNVEVQTDTRDGTDYSLNGSYQMEVGGGMLDLSGVFVRTDRYQDEDSLEYAEGVETAANLVSSSDNDLDIRTDNLSLNARYDINMLGGETHFRLGYADIDDQQFEFEDELNFEDAEFESARTLTDLKDEEWSGRISHERDFGGAVLEVGFDYIDKTRDTLIQESGTDGDLDDAPATEGDYSDYEPVTGGFNTIEETRFDPYVMLSGEQGRAKWEAGLRYETTDTTITDETADAADRVTDNDYGVLLPSASLRLALNERDRLTLSVARTVRRPDFNALSPALLEEEVGDSDFIGNPDLEPETAWGLDVGVERRLGRRGVVGLNAFYRDISDLIENVNTGVEGSEGEGTFVYSVDNVGDGEVWGIEFDLSTPLDFIGMETTGVFLNYSWLDSAVDDFLGERRFNSQSDYVLNAGFTHDIPSWGAAFGATYRKQGDASSRVIAEEVVTSYGADLEIFIEKKVADNIVVRFTGSNLLNASKDETFDKFDNLADQIDRDYDEYEIETEEAGPWFQVVARMAF